MVNGSGGKVADGQSPGGFFVEVQVERRWGPQQGSHSGSRKEKMAL